MEKFECAGCAMPLNPDNIKDGYVKCEWCGNVYKLGVDECPDKSDTQRIKVDDIVGTFRQGFITAEQMISELEILELDQENIKDEIPFGICVGIEEDGSILAKLGDSRDIVRFQDSSSLGNGLVYGKGTYLI